MDSVFDDTEKYAKFWTDMASKLMSTGMSLGPDKAPPEVSRQMRSLAFQAMSQSAEQYMRTPQFMEMMKQMLDASIGFKKQTNEFLTQVQHAVQGVAQQDLANVQLSVKHMETRVLDRLDEIAQKFDSITARLDALEARRSEAKRAKVASNEQS